MFTLAKKIRNFSDFKTSTRQDKNERTRHTTIKCCLKAVSYTHLITNFYFTMEKEHTESPRENFDICTMRYVFEFSICM